MSLSNVVYIFLKYVWVKKHVKISVILFKNICLRYSTKRSCNHPYIFGKKKKKEKKNCSAMLCCVAEFIAMDTNNTVVGGKMTSNNCRSWSMWPCSLFSLFLRVTCRYMSHAYYVFLAFLRFLSQKRRSNIPMKLWVITTLNCYEY